MSGQVVENLLVFGDSWPAGEELENAKAHCFPQVIAQNLSLNLQNYSQPSTSAVQALHKMLHGVLSFDKSIVLFCLTGMSRSMLITDKDQLIELNPLVQSAACTAYYKYIHSRKLDQFNRLQCILAAQQLCGQKQVKCLFVNNWDPLPAHDAIDMKNFFPHTLTQIIDLGVKDDITPWTNKDRLSKFIWPNGCHPNKDGHTQIGNTLSTWIKEKINESVS